jgi:hypothetical protein
MTIWKEVVEAPELPRLGAYPESPLEAEDNAARAKAQAAVWAIEKKLREAQVELARAQAAMPEYWVERRGNCGGAHTHGAWCYTSHVRFSVPPAGVKTYPDRLCAERAAVRADAQSSKDWQDFLAC